MIVVIDRDTDGAACGRLRAMGKIVLEPPTHGNAGREGRCTQEFHACLLAAWYLVVARRAVQGGGLFAGVVFVRGGPLTMDSGAPLRGPWESKKCRAAHARLRGLLAAEFRADAYVLFPNVGRGRAAAALNARYWSVYRGLHACGARTFVI